MTAMAVLTSNCCRISLIMGIILGGYYWGYWDADVKRIFMIFFQLISSSLSIAARRLTCQHKRSHNQIQQLSGGHVRKLFVDVWIYPSQLQRPKQRQAGEPFFVSFDFLFFQGQRGAVFQDIGGLSQPASFTWKFEWLWLNRRRLKHHETHQLRNNFSQSVLF